MKETVFGIHIQTFFAVASIPNCHYFFQLDMEEMVENQVRTMFLLEQKTQGSRPLTVVSSPSPNSAPPSKTSSPAAASSQSPAAPEIKQQSPFNRTDNRRFSLFRRKKT